MIWFDRKKALGLTATLEVRIRTGQRRKGMPFTVRVSDGRMRIRPGAPQQPVVTASLDLRDLIRLGIGAAGWPELLSSGRLQLSGDPFVALRFPALFRLPV
jgi:hypothetical protein